MPPHHDNRGLKRKRPTASTEEDLTLKVARKLHHGLKEVRKAAKKAKSFENQKMVKKLKLLRKDPEKNGQEIKDMEAQLETLKNTNHDRIGTLALRSKLKKDKILSSNSSVTSAIATELPPGTSTSTNTDPKVDSRLLSSKALASEVNLFVASLRLVINPQAKLDTEAESPRPTKLQKQDLPEGDHQSESEAEDIADLRIEDEPVDESSAVLEGDGWESGTIDGDSDEDDEDEDHKSSDGEERAPKSQQEKPKATYATSVKERPKPTESAFLPSLSVGFTRGDSDSEFSDGEEKPTERKNRRGQRARRAIWEKKYGRGAKHLNSEAQETANKSNGPNHGRSAGSSTNFRPNHTENSYKRNDSARSHQPAPPNRTFNAPPSRSRSDRPPPPPAREERPLHPSWEAKKKLKEKESGAIVPPQNKRITFD
ncbi:Bud-site selection protein [Stereum hirsutum FP-91666 SS1]|uniref:Bud-site selection protein n=1 Tax=Stereum hirsutum (strain FP-91666) TaxID=721885 RepID=UPI000444A50D|nr:Bud-site selection protein [Stereum hirsutum FP-91666 SS1]EIM86046.1 Bud-site selection protein [Stereum hirsutum FP-91666 SS1]